MKIILLLLTILSSFAFSAIDECKTDVYFANGILTKQRIAIRNAGILEKAIKQRLGIDYYNKNIGKVDYAYNRSNGTIIDLLESLVQKANGNFFAYEAYNKLHNWMKNYWEAISIATPMNGDIKQGTPRINWDNDLVARLAHVNLKSSLSAIFDGFVHKDSKDTISNVRKV